MIYTSRARKAAIRRGQYMHRAVMEKLLGRPLGADEHVHHQDFDKTHNCPQNLILMPWYFNPSNGIRDPYTGEFLSAGAYLRRYGDPFADPVGDVPF